MMFSSTVHRDGQKQKPIVQLLMRADLVRFRIPARDFDVRVAHSGVLRSRNSGFLLAP